MKATDGIKEVMKRKDIKPYVLRGRLGIDAKNNSTLLMRLNQDNISVSKANEMLKAMDYKIVIMPAETRMNSEWIEIE